MLRQCLYTVGQRSVCTICLRSTAQHIPHKWIRRAVFRGWGQLPAIASPARTLVRSRMEKFSSFWLSLFSVAPVSIPDEIFVWGTIIQLVWGSVPHKIQGRSLGGGWSSLQTLSHIFRQQKRSMFKNSAQFIHLLILDQYVSRWTLSNILGA